MIKYHKQDDEFNISEMNVYDIYIRKYFKVLKVFGGYIYFIWDDTHEPAQYSPPIFVSTKV